MVYTEEQKQILGENIWVRREMLNKSTVELGQELGVRRNTVRTWERGVCVPEKDTLRKLSKIFGCSINDLHRKYRVPSINLVEEKKIDAPANIKHKPEQRMIHPVAARLSKYLANNHISQYKFADMAGMSSGTVWRVKNSELDWGSEYYTKVDLFLDSVEKPSTEPETIDDTPEIELEPVPENESQKPNPAANPGSISERLNDVYDTLFNALDELDKLKADIAKIERVTSLLKEIQGL